MQGQRKAGTTGILVRVQEADKKRIEQAARAANMTVSDLARAAIFDRVEVIEGLFNLQPPEKLENK